MRDSKHYEDLFYKELVDSNTANNPRFVKRDWLAKAVRDEMLLPDCRFVLLTAEPGFGKSVLIAQLALNNPNWPRYFIRRDRRESMAGVDSHSFLLRLGYQPAARYPELFTPRSLKLVVQQRVGNIADKGDFVGAEVNKLIASPFWSLAKPRGANGGIRRSRATISRKDSVSTSFSTLTASRSKSHFRTIWLNTPTPTCFNMGLLLTLALRARRCSTTNGRSLEYIMPEDACRSRIPGATTTAMKASVSTASSKTCRPQSANESRMTD